MGHFQPTSRVLHRIDAVLTRMESGEGLYRACASQKLSPDTVYRWIERSRSGDVNGQLASRWDDIILSRQDRDVTECDMCGQRLLRGKYGWSEMYRGSKIYLSFCSIACRREWEDGDLHPYENGEGDEFLSLLWIEERINR
jgi:hypothetical protein